MPRGYGQEIATIGFVVWGPRNCFIFSTSLAESVSSVSGRVCGGRHQPFHFSRRCVFSIESARFDTKHGCRAFKQACQSVNSVWQRDETKVNDGNRNQTFYCQVRYSAGKNLPGDPVGISVP
jgi:hypothetical protein